MNFTPIAGLRVSVRDFSEKDLAEFARYRALPEVARYQSWERFGLEDARRLYAAQQTVTFGTPGSWHQVAITDKRDDSLLGDCALHFLEDGRQMEIGFTLAPAHQGRGLAREAVGLLLGHVFGPMQRHRVIAVTDAENLPAQKLLTALGFRKEAHYLKNVFFKGRWEDECLFAQLASEWELKNPPIRNRAP
ncbi:MAG TPA: GNAT family protein [Gammaproteobacteria bacterium]|nr:GNAT family protein [Gammaproteobacteria bacterium]